MMLAIGLREGLKWKQVLQMAVLCGLLLVLNGSSVLADLVVLKNKVVFDQAQVVLHNNKVIGLRWQNQLIYIPEKYIETIIDSKTSPAKASAVEKYNGSSEYQVAKSLDDLKKAVVLASPLAVAVDFFLKDQISVPVCVLLDGF